MSQSYSMAVRFRNMIWGTTIYIYIRPVFSFLSLFFVRRQIAVIAQRCGPVLVGELIQQFQWNVWCDLVNWLSHSFIHSFLLLLVIIWARVGFTSCSPCVEYLCDTRGGFTHGGWVLFSIRSLKTMSEYHYVTRALPLCIGLACWLSLSGL